MTTFYVRLVTGPEEIVAVEGNDWDIEATGLRIESDVAVTFFRMETWSMWTTDPEVVARWGYLMEEVK